MTFHEIIPGLVMTFIGGAILGAYIHTLYQHFIRWIDKQ